MSNLRTEEFLFFRQRHVNGLMNCGAKGYVPLHSHTYERYFLIFGPIKHPANEFPSHSLAGFAENGGIIYDPRYIILLF